MCVKSGAKMAEFAQTKPPSGREGDRGSGGRSPRNFSLLQISPSEYQVKDYVLHLVKFFLMSRPLHFYYKVISEKSFSLRLSISASLE